MPAFILIFLSNIITPIFQFFMKRVGRATAITLAFTVFFTSCLAALVAFFYGLIAAAAYASPPSLIQAASLVVPDNAHICIAVTMSARIGLYVWDLTINKFNYIFLPPA